MIFVMGFEKMMVVVEWMMMMLSDACDDSGCQYPLCLNDSFMSW